MADAKRRKRGEETIKKIYAGDVVVPPEGANPFADVMLEQLFAETWNRGGLSVRDRRLLIMGVIAALGEKDTWKLQVRSALKNGELSEEQVHEVTIMLAQYAGYPRAAGLLGPTFEAIAEAKA
jgi:4-carboxymuconolactone decarboxylase